VDVSEGRLLEEHTEVFYISEVATYVQPIPAVNSGIRAGPRPTDCMIRRLLQLRANGRVTGVLVLLAAVLLWPSVSLGATGSFWFPAADGSCYDVKPLENHSTLGASVTPVSEVETEDDTPCSVDDDADAASNICLEAANSPISTLPRLIAEANGKETADMVVESILERMERNDVDTEQVELAVTPSPDAAPVDDATGACSTDTEECRSLPPAPPTLQLDGSSAAARHLLAAIELQDASDDERVNAWAHLRVGPQDGHQRDLDRPPQRA
jgi:hypothetical protein